MHKSMANPRLPPPDETFDHARLSRNPGREPRLSLREATQQAIASRAGNPARTVQQRAEAAALMASTETMMKFGFMSMSLTYFSSLNMIK
ncbi:MAG: hypothetical protein EBV89_10760, partial [Betaproteobacteria bacterium]|nr:hypothetical protein [Betaproteobacteria bacterium]